MTARLLDGVATADRIRAELKPRVEAFAAAFGRPPGLGIILVGEDPSSEIYVRGKLKSAADVGLRADLERLPATASLADLLARIESLNHSDAHDGILVQSPLPAAMGADAEPRVFDAVLPQKDVDGLHAVNVGKLVQNRAELVSCTPAGVIELLERERIQIAGRRAVVVGRSNIVGKPMALLLLHRHATVTICHSRTPDLAAITREADLVVAAIGRPGFVTADFVKAGATVVDVGITSVSDRATLARMYPPESKRWTTFEKNRSLVVGDVHPGVADVAGALTPVPRGIGPLTIVMLLKNTLTAAKMRTGWAG
jgi:methylenetetrahydrofolate dehydrogenase (NADP+)/methenyltetrahydrofolate cyclohydrolase